MSALHVFNDGFAHDSFKLASDFGVRAPLPVTVINSTEALISASWLNSTLSDFLAKDDVYSEGFSSGKFCR